MTPVLEATVCKVSPYAVYLDVLQPYPGEDYPAADHQNC